MSTNNLYPTLLVRYYREKYTKSNSVAASGHRRSESLVTSGNFLAQAALRP